MYHTAPMQQQQYQPNSSMDNNTCRSKYETEFKDTTRACGLSFSLPFMIDSNANADCPNFISNSNSNSKRRRTSISLSDTMYYYDHANGHTGDHTDGHINGHTDGRRTDIDSGYLPPQCDPFLLDPIGVHSRKSDSPSTNLFTPICTNVRSQSPIIEHNIHGYSYRQNHCYNHSYNHNHNHNHSAFVPFDQDDTAEIAKGAAALCFMKEQVQVGVGSTSYNRKYGIDTDNDTDIDIDIDIDTHNDGVKTATMERTKQIRGYTISPPARLALDNVQESKHVNSLHQFVRAELLDIFSIPLARAQNEHSVPSKRSLRSNSNTPKRGNSASRLASVSPPSNSPSNPSHSSSYSSARQYPGRVGLRCIYCIHTPKKKQTPAASFFPKNCADIYRQTCNWQRVHCQQCSSIPLSVKNKYMQLKQNDKTRGKTKYWETSAKAIGLEDDREGRNGIVWNEEGATGQ